VMLATETGIWTTDNILAQNVIWAPENQGLANVRIDMLKFRKSDNTVLAATHGRGMFTTIWSPNQLSGINREIGIADRVQVFPNPTGGRFEVRLDNPVQSNLIILDVSGRVIMNQEIREQSGTWQKTFDLTKQPKGIYLVKVESKDKISTTRLVLR